MDKILEKLAGVLTAEDLQEIKESFENSENGNITDQN